MQYTNAIQSAFENLQTSHSSAEIATLRRRVASLEARGRRATRVGGDHGRRHAVKETEQIGCRQQRKTQPAQGAPQAKTARDSTPSPPPTTVAGDQGACARRMGAPARGQPRGIHPPRGRLAGGTRIAHDKADFVRKIQEAHESGKSPLVDGYAPFCKHVFVENFVGAKVGNVEITKSNEHLLKSGYSARSEAELAVLTRWFQASDVEAPEATHLDVILYSREQLELERAAVPSKSERPPLPNAPWGIISVKAQSEDYETPMQPITMMRNALGREQGGSGVPLEKDKYDASVAYWANHAPIVASEDGAAGD